MNLRCQLRYAFLAGAGLLATFCFGAAPKPDVVVAADGTGNFTSLQEAISTAPMRTDPASPPWLIAVKPGTYHERIYVQRERGNIHILGENAATTIVTYELNANLPGPDGKPIGTFRTPSTTIDADDFTAVNLTFENSAGPKGQALAIRVDGDRAVFRNCHFLGWQDTILLNRGRQYFENCHIAGHVDFIFGAATAFFEKCHIHCLGDGYITAASTPYDQPFGFVFANCKITGDPPESRSFLGRPWRIYASTIFLNTEMSEVVRAQAWHNWNKPEAEKTARYAEFGSTGAGAKPESRPAWTKQLGKAEAAAVTRQKVLGGLDGWNPKP